MSKKLYYLLVILFLITHNYIHPSSQKELLKNLSLLYAGSGLGLWSIAHIAAKLSGAVPVYPETRGKNVFSPPIDHWESKDETESMVQKGLIKVANLFLKVSKVVAAPVTRSAFLSTLTVFKLKRNHRKFFRKIIH